ncbi:MAG: protein kinase, partial [Gemmatimonadales bacterium]
SVVYRAWDTVDLRTVAIKVLKHQYATVLGPTRFLREIRLQTQLHHPGILPLLDSGRSDTLFYFTMPLVEGETLQARLEREPQLPLDTVRQILSQVAAALDYAHDAGVLHRDIKPSNLFVCGDRTLIADFGIAKDLTPSEQESTTSTGLVLGTALYMSPEQADGSQHADRRADVYSLGCVAYQMVAGEPPFTGPNTQAVIARHRSMPAPSARVVRPELPRGVDAVLRKALAKSPADRYQTAGEFASALCDPAKLAAAASEAQAEEATVRGDHATATARRWRPRAAAIAVACLLVVLVGAAVGAKLHRSDLKPAMAGVRVMVLPFVGETDSIRTVETSAHLRFTEALGWIPGVQGIDGTSLARGPGNVPAKSLQDLLQEARRAGAKYLVTGAVLGGGSRVSIDLYSTVTGARVAHSADTVSGERLDGAIGRLAFQSIGAFARQEGLDSGGSRAVLASTSSIAAAGHLLRGQAKFGQADYAAAADELRAAVEADSGCGLAYHRLGVAETWQHNYPAALAALDAGLARRDRLAPRWVNLLEAQRYYVLGLGDSAIAAFQGTVLDDRNEVDGWLGLGESLVHFAGFTGHSALDARSAFERVALLDSSFALIYDHLTDLSVYAGDERAARTYLARLSADNPLRVGKEATVTLRFGSPKDRAAALAQLRSTDREVLREAVIFWSHGGFDLGLADSAAGDLMGGHRTPDDRRRGAQYRLVVRTSQGRLSEGIRDWSSAAGAYPFDPWMVQVYLAGYPVREVVAPMFAWARAQVDEEGIPDFGRPPWDEGRQAFEALVYRATLEGDSAEALDLLERIKRAPSPNQTEPSPGALQASLDARLALLAGDTAATIASLRRALSRIAEPYTANHPLMAMAPQRLLLSELTAKRGDSVEAGRWRDSFSNSWSIADVLYLARLGRLDRRP